MINDKFVKVCDCVHMLAQGIDFLFPVQTSTFDHIYDGDDVIVQASKCCSCLILKLSVDAASLCFDVTAFLGVALTN